jgi:formylglycine-generating enzyme required for sulfatase activity
MMAVAQKPTRLLLAVAIVLPLFAAPAQAAVKLALDPGRANTLSFPAVEARFVRLAISRSHTSQPCIDELEIFGPGSSDNLALASRGAKASASSCFAGNAFHQVAHLNDGKYGNAHSWIAASESGWAQIELARPALVDRVVLSRDRDGKYTDRVPAALAIQVSTDGAQWRTVLEVESVSSPIAESILVWPSRPTWLDFAPHKARFVRMAISRTSGGPPCIDELELYGLDKKNLALASAGARASASSCIQGYAAHRVEHLNDGKYGNARSWIPQESPAWAQIELPAPTTVCRLAFSRDRTGGYLDRVPTNFEILVSLDGQKWNVVKKITALPDPAVDQPVAGELPQDWAWRIVTRLSGPMRKAGESRRKQVRTLADARAMLDLFRLDQERLILQRRLALEYNVEALRRAVKHLTAAYPGRFQAPANFDARLEADARRIPQLRETLDRGTPAEIARAMAEGEQLLAFPRSVLLANPLLDFKELLVLKRKTPPEQKAIYWQWGLKYGMPVNWSCDFRPKNQPVAAWWDDEFVAVDWRGGRRLRTVFKPPATHMLQHPELHFDAEKLLFSMPGPNGAFQVFEVRTDGSQLRQITRDTAADVDNGDPCYLPNGRIVFNSTRMFGGVPCEDGESYISGLCLTDADGRHTRMLTFDQESNWYPSLLHDGRVLYTRYEYANLSHQFGRHLFHMNPDGSSQMEYYGSNSYWPNSIFYARAVPGHPTMVVGVVCGHHGPNRTGRLVLFDPARGRRETAGAVQTIPGYGKPVERVVADVLYGNDWPKFVHPWPLSDKYFLVAARPGPEQTEYALYLVDVFDNVTLLCRLPEHSLLEPIPIRRRPVPPVIPDRVNPEAGEGLVYLADVYQGPGLRGVPRDAVKELRLFTYNYVYRHVSRRGFGHLATPGVDGPWEPRYLLGTVPVRNDGSALFRVPANTPISVQPLDAQGRALQQMRSWFTAMPGETLSCVGCHEPQNGSPPAAVGGILGRPDRIAPWRGPARGFDFEREVQPVLDRFCVGCHDGTHKDRPDLARKSDAEKKRISEDYRKLTETSISTIFTPAFIALHPYVRRPHAESNHAPKAAGDYFADTSLLVQMLVKGHHNVSLDQEAWQRLYAWIDLGAPDHGSWHNSVWGSPENYHQRRLEMLAQFANRTDDVEWMPPPAKEIARFSPPPKETAAQPAPACPGWPFDVQEARRRQQAAGLPATMQCEIAKGLSLEFVLVPPGEFVMGDPNGAADERLAARVRIDRPFYMSRTEVTNAQFAALVDPLHESGHADWLSIDWRGEGYPLSGSTQPVVRVSWLEACQFCRALGRRLGRRMDLPSEAEWEWACRAGSAGPLWYGGLDDDFSPLENLAGREQRELAFMLKPKWFLRDDRFDDHQLVSAPVGSFRPNAWGLHDMSGNVAEWTRSEYRPYPYLAAADRSADESPETDRVVRGGSWRSRPRDATSAHRWKYPAWRKVYDVGFRVVLEAPR